MGSSGDLPSIESNESPTNDEESSPSRFFPNKIDKDELEETQSNAGDNYKFGVIYLSYIPEGMNVKVLREIMGQFGQVGRIYLEPDEKAKKHRSYIEGWVEFPKKRVAKSVAKSLNGTPINYGRRHCKFNGQVWSIKYLHRFKWAHLTEQLTHDKAVRNQKRSLEMSQAKKESDFYQKMTARSKMMKKQKHETKKDSELIMPKQNKPTSGGEELKVSVDEELLTSIFKKVS